MKNHFIKTRWKIIVMVISSLLSCHNPLGEVQVNIKVGNDLPTAIHEVSFLNTEYQTPLNDNILHRSIFVNDSDFIPVEVFSDRLPDRPDHVGWGWNISIPITRDIKIIPIFSTKTHYTIKYLLEYDPADGVILTLDSHVNVNGSSIQIVQLMNSIQTIPVHWISQASGTLTMNLYHEWESDYGAFVPEVVFWRQLGTSASGITHITNITLWDFTQGRFIPLTQGFTAPRLRFAGWELNPDESGEFDFIATPRWNSFMGGNTFINQAGINTLKMPDTDTNFLCNHIGCEWHKQHAPQFNY